MVLRLYGGVGWAGTEPPRSVTGTKRVAILLMLTEHQGSTVSVGTIIDRLWGESPRSGANAVQRHVSALRAELRRLGAPDDCIQTVPGGYRLAKTMPTDLTLMTAADIHDPFDARLPTWWEQPLVGAPYEGTESLRRRLEDLALTMLRRAVAVAEAKDCELMQQRINMLLTHHPEPDAIYAQRDLLPADDEIAPADLRAPGTTTIEGIRTLTGLWLDGRGSEALDLLEGKDFEVPEDLSRRLCRALIWLDPDEGWSRHAMAVVVEDAVTDRASHERSIVSLDARALEADPDGREIAAREVVTASTSVRHLRALRVQYMLSLSEPHRSWHDTIVEEIGAIELPDAQVEARRFAFLSALRTGNYDQADEMLDRYGAENAGHWGVLSDDFAPMARAVLQRSLDPAAAAMFGTITPLLPNFSADRWAVQVADLTRRLVQNPPNEPLSDTDFHVCLATLSRAAADAANLLRDMNAGRPIEDAAHRLASELPERRWEKQFLFLPIALGLVAETLGDEFLASRAIAALAPWSGQCIGMWPVDAFFGPADHWLERFARV